ncbi:hypothetical protein RCK87_26945, partial [Salmonella enterica subsp. enterica serovar 1,4,[5],12:i:-]
MQQPPAFDAGVSTEVPRADAVETSPLTTDLPVPSRAEPGLGPEAQLRLDRMEARLRALGDQPDALTRADLQ